jgi:hypothetical protein
VSDAEITSIASEVRRVRAPAFWCALQWRIGHRSGEVARQAVILAEAGEDVVREVCANTEAHGGFLAYFDQRPGAPLPAA